MVGLRGVACGADPIELVNVGNPESHELFRARYPQSATPLSPPPPPPHD